MRFVRVSTVLAAAGVAGLACVPQALATVPHIRGPIASFRCPPAPLLCTKKLRPGVTLQHLRAKLRSGTTQDIYKVSWPLGSSHVRLAAEALNQPYNGVIRLGTISHWASQSAGSGLLAALNGDFFVSVGWTSGHPSGMLVQSRNVVAFGTGDAGVGYEPNGRMIMGTPSAKPAKLLLPGGKSATIESFDSGSSDLTKPLGDQVIVKTIAGSGTTPLIPTNYTGYIVGSAQSPSPFATMLRGVSQVKNPNGVDKLEWVKGYRIGDGGSVVTTDALPITAASNPVTLTAGQALVIARSNLKNSIAATGLTRLATHSHVVSLTVDAEAWSHVTDVMGGKPQLVKNGKVEYPTAWHNPPMMSGDGWQWDYPHWRPALAETKTRGWLVITGGVRHGDGVYGWNWGKMLVQLGARNAMGFDNNSSTELYVPHQGTWTFSRGWQREITEATALYYH